MDNNPEIPLDPFIEHRQRYAEILAKYIPKELLQRNGTVRVISVGGADGLEGQALMEAAEEINPNVNIYFEGIDINKDGIRRSRTMNPKIPPENYKVADARDAENFGPDPWDLIIVRNPNIREMAQYMEGVRVVSEVWMGIFRNSVEKLNKGGYLFVTDYSEDEQKLILGLLNSKEDYPDLQILLRASAEDASSESYLSEKGPGFMLEKTVTVFRKN